MNDETFCNETWEKLQKQKPVHSKKIRDSAMGEECTMGSPRCNGNPASVCLRHSNLIEHGKGRGYKTSDLDAFYGCQGCEDWFTDPKVDRDLRYCLYERAKIRTHLRLKEKGLI
jgi:hypothetical protein